MECRVLGDVDGGPAVELDHRAFAYAGKFVMTSTGKAIAREHDDIVAAVAFNRDRTDHTIAWLRYVSVRIDRRGEGIGPRLLDFAAGHLLEAVERVKIGVNNPFAYQAAYKAGFAFTGEETGIAELVLVRPGDRSPAGYRTGLRRFADRAELTPAERAFVGERRESDPPCSIAVSKEP